MHEIKSPCIKVCITNDKAQYCIGCFRNTEDVIGWKVMTNPEKKQVLQKCKENRRDSLMGCKNLMDNKC